MSDESDELDYITSIDGSRAIMREINKITAKERLKAELPLLMAAVAQELVKAGVDFSKAKGLRPEGLSEEDWDAITEDLMG